MFDMKLMDMRLTGFHVLSVCFSAAPSLPSSVCPEAWERQCQHVNRYVILLVAVLLAMLSTPATGSQANKVSNRGNHAREERRRTFKTNFTSDLYMKPVLT